MYGLRTSGSPGQQAGSLVQDKAGMVSCLQCLSRMRDEVSYTSFFLKEAQLSELDRFVSLVSSHKFY